MAFLQVHADDDMLVALSNFQRGDVIRHAGQTLTLLDDVPAKHKFAIRDFGVGDRLRMYGIVVAKARHPIRAGQRLNTANIVHATDDLIDRSTITNKIPSATNAWQPPDVTRWHGATFDGFARQDGRVGTRNHWLVVPLVFCENRNLRVMREAMLEELGYATDASYRNYTRRLIDLLAEGKSHDQIVEVPLEHFAPADGAKRIFPNVDGIKFLAHDGGCGCGYDDALNLCRLLAGYINHPNVAGATVLSLGCQKSQIADLENELHKLNPQFQKPLYIFDQQKLGTEQTLLAEAIRHTFAGLIGANKAQRQPAPLSQLTVGLECGGSDGFSGLSANPAIGHFSDLLVALGGKVILSEFPELAGCENNLASRCTTPEVADRFLNLMKGYESHLVADGNYFENNPSPGNIRDGLTTDAIKSAGAARKGGSSPVTDVLDYPEPATKPGLNLLCTPGGDVESTTAMAGSGATVMLFSTGLGTPTGNPISPVLKISSNTELAQRMPDIIDCDAGGIIAGNETIESIGGYLLDLVVAAASGKQPSKAELLGQDDFVPWKRSLTF
ncbi:MAG: altronate dehydratase [Planctomycetes bacterium]|nr:altronate dehydratase [Planctomycetota bacterium]